MIDESLQRSGQQEAGAHIILYVIYALHRKLIWVIRLLCEKQVEKVTG